MNRAQQVCQVGASGEIVPPRVDNLPKQRDLFCAARHNPAAFFDDFLERAAAFAPAPQRDDAERA